MTDIERAEETIADAQGLHIKKLEECRDHWLNPSVELLVGMECHKCDAVAVSHLDARAIVACESVNNMVLRMRQMGLLWNGINWGKAPSATEATRDYLALVAQRAAGILRIMELEAVLKLVEWVDMSTNLRHCPACGSTKQHGHHAAEQRERGGVRGVGQVAGQPAAGPGPEHLRREEVDLREERQAKGGRQ